MTFAPIRYWDCPGSCNGHDPNDPTNPGFHEWPKLLPNLRPALNRYINTNEIDPNLYLNDPTYHAIITLITRGRREG